MSKTYLRESGSNFPDSLITLSKFKDIDDTVKDIAVQYYNFMSAGNINSASALIEANSKTLAPYWIDSKEINKLEEELYNIGLFAVQLRINVVSDTEPTESYVPYTYWIKPVK